MPLIFLVRQAEGRLFLAMLTGVAWLPQERTEALGLLLAGICVATPSLQQRLLALQSGRTTTDGDSLSGGTRLFKLLPALTDAAKQVRIYAIH